MLAHVGGVRKDLVTDLVTPEGPGLKAEIQIHSTIHTYKNMICRPCRKKENSNFKVTIQGILIYKDMLCISYFYNM